MAKLNIQRTRDLLQQFDFRLVFTEELGWSQASSRKSISWQKNDAQGERVMIAQLAGVAVFEVTTTGGNIPNPTTCRALMIRHAEGPGTRLDSGITQGAAITTAFDPMLAKLIVHGKDRAEARQRALAALKDFVLLGCETNVAFLRRLIAHEAFRAGDVHTGFIDAHPEIAAAPVPPPTLERMLAVAALAVRPVRDAADGTPQPHQQMGGWRN